MQFALPPRRSQVSLPYAHSAQLSRPRGRHLKAAALLGVGLLSVLYLLLALLSTTSGDSAVPVGTPSVVLVTVLDREKLSASYMNTIVNNREDYAMRHGKLTLIVSWSETGWAPESLCCTLINSFGITMGTTMITKFKKNRIHQFLCKYLRL